MAEVLPLLAVVATMPAFLFDHYLLKNFAVSFWWWFVVALEVGLVGGIRRDGAHPGTGTEVAA